MKVLIETERLKLRELLPTYVDGMFELDSDPEVHRYLGNEPVSDKKKIIEIIEFVRQQYNDNGIGRWAIIDKKTNEFIGWSGLKFVTELTNGHQNYYDLGYRLIRRYWGKGIATETAVASLDYAFNQLNTVEVYASASCDNVASNKILQKVGLKLMETYFDEGVECNWYKISKEDYRKK